MLGDRQAFIAAYPHIDLEVLDTYVQDSQCGTWEPLQHAIRFPQRHMGIFREQAGHHR